MKTYLIQSLEYNQKTLRREMPNEMGSFSCGTKVTQVDMIWANDLEKNHK